MLRSVLKKTSLFILFFSSIASYSQYYKLSDKSKVSILTCGSGEELYSIYGHTAIRVLDSINGIDVVYNYGNFDFGTPNFYPKFVKGDLQYFASASSFQDFISDYVYDNRDVFEQNLLISLDQKQRLFDEINASLYSDEKFYTYKFIDKNCTTMVLNKVNAVFGSTVVTKKLNIDVSYRTVLYSYLDNHFFENLGINIIFGKKTDAPATKLFLPKELMDNLKISRFNNKPIVEEVLVLNKKNPEKVPVSYWNNFYFFSFLLLIILVLNRKVIHLVYFSILGSMGVFLTLVGFYSLHHEVSQNYNILLFNPSLLLLVYSNIRKKNKWIVNLSYFNMASLAVYLVVIVTKVDFIMMLPLILVSGVILSKFAIQSKSY
ncbi:lipoprotein N-acyltransferase Lnb domain-containing protein [Flavobacterium psychrotolerans]|uniref:Uncharacterized protein n=1 Tax=Flavobacterium psychrotolerans TaxID=2169410 RepID=A0A2U1JR42_9FLAO|nr:DUF4105 domain-containing protein [Flavobacterium psychrotolerans]PWA07485.1 hypothetical protein DB895_01870 [Flavobacterium psychrotolerans]